MTKTLLRFTTPDGSYDVRNIDGEYYYRWPVGMAMRFDDYDEAKSWFTDALRCARNKGLHPVVEINDEEQHSSSEEVECKTLNEPVRTLTEPAAI